MPESIAPRLVSPPGAFALLLLRCTRWPTAQRWSSRCWRPRARCGGCDDSGRSRCCPRGCSSVGQEACRGRGGMEGESQRVVLAWRALHCMRVQGYLAAMSASSYSFVSMLQRFGPLMNPGGAVINLTYNASNRVIPGYGGGMSSAKAVRMRAGWRQGLRSAQHLPAAASGAPRSPQGRQRRPHACWLAVCAGVGRRRWRATRACWRSRRAASMACASTASAPGRWAAAPPRPLASSTT